MKLRILAYRATILLALTGTVLFSCTKSGDIRNKKTIIEDKVHASKVFHENRYFRVFLPPEYYSDTNRRYPVIYFFHGFGGRYNGPANGEPSVSAEARYYDEFNGDLERCGPDSLDNIVEFVSNNNVIVAKWDGFVNEQYPRPYDIGPVIQDIQFVDYFKEFVGLIDSTYRTISSREGRAVSGLSMGGFMSMNIAAKFPHLISSASFFCPSGGFSIGPKELQVFTPMKDMKMNYVGLPIRMHIGQNDFLRQYHYEMDDAFKKYGLSYESWQYGSNYFNGFHNVVNVKGQFDFHMKNFRNPTARPEKWHHIDVFPSFEVWGYSIKSDRKVPGFTILENAGRHGFKVSTRKWLPDGPSITNQTLDIETDSLYESGEKYQIVTAQAPFDKIVEQTVEANNGRIHLKCEGTPTDIGIYRQGDPGFLSMSGFTTSEKMPKSGNVLEITPVLFNKGGQDLSEIEAELISNDANAVVLSLPQAIDQISKTTIYKESKFKVIATDPNVRSVILKLKLSYNDQSEIYRFEVPFFNADYELKSFLIADGIFCRQEKSGKEESMFGKGNGNEIAEPGEKISFLAQPDKENPNWYGLKVYTDDPFVDSSMEEVKFNSRNDWSGGMRSTSEIYISSQCPDKHVIQLYGEFDFPAKGNIPRDNQAATSFIKHTNRVFFNITVHKRN